MPRGDSEVVEWWVDEIALPDILWARLSVDADGAANVLDHTGRTRRFPSRADAANWLLEEECVRPSGLDHGDLSSFGMAQSELAPPEDAVSHASLVRRCVCAQFVRELAAVRLLPPWVRLDSKGRLKLERELGHELAEGHELFERPVRAVARRQDRDDVLFVVAQPDELAVVHLTFSGSPANPPWPRTVTFDAAWKFVDRAIADAQEFGAA